MKRWLHACFATSLVLPALAMAAAPDMRIDAITQHGDAIEITGVWPNSCQPQLEAQTSDAFSLDVLLADGGNICTPTPSGFTISIAQRENAFSPAPAADAVRPLHVFATAGSDSQPALVAFRLLGGSGPHVHPDTGFWWPTGQDVGAGSVLSIELQDQALGVALMSYDDTSGDPIWYFGTTELAGNVAHVELTRMQYGASPFGSASAQPQPRPALAIDLQFLSATRARAWMSRSQEGLVGIELASMDFARVPFSNLPQAENWLGPWLLAATPSVRDEAALPRMLVWADSVALDEQRFRLLDESGTYALECRHTGVDEDFLAQRCVLRNESNGVVARFDQVGLQRLDGVRADGSPVVMIRAQ